MTQMWVLLINSSYTFTVDKNASNTSVILLAADQPTAYLQVVADSVSCASSYPPADELS